MKKIFFTLIATSFTLLSFAQITKSQDTSYTSFGKGTTVHSTITLSNPTANPITVNYNVDMAATIVPTGYSTISVCEIIQGGIGQCFPVNGNVNTYTLAPNSSLGLEVSVSANIVAVDSPCYLVINTDANGGDKIVYKFHANWAASVNNIKNNKINLDIYPTPATNILNVVHNNKNVAKASVYNMLGRKLNDYNTPVNANGFSIPVAELADGMYMIVVRDANGNSLATKRFQKQ